MLWSVFSDDSPRSCIASHKIRVTLAFWRLANCGGDTYGFDRAPWVLGEWLFGRGGLCADGEAGVDGALGVCGWVAAVT